VKASLVLENIGKKVGKDSFSFTSGVITLIRGRNGSGKSRIIKSCAIALSLPINSKELEEEAINFGVIKGENAEFSPLVNSKMKKAFIELQYDNIIKKVELDLDGKNNINVPGEQKFLYSSLIVRTSKIYNYISRGDSNFKWILDEMSLAKNYETIQDIVGSYFEVLDLKKKEIDQKEKENRAITDRLNELTKEKTKYDKEIQKLIEKIELEIEKVELNPKLREKRSKIKEIIDDLTNKIKNYNKETKELEQQNSEFERILRNSEHKIKRISSEISETTRIIIELKAINRQQLTQEMYELEQAKPRELKGSYEGEVKNLREVLKKLGKKNEIECYLCHEGKIRRENIEVEIEKIQKERMKIEKTIKDIQEEIREKSKLIKESNRLPEIQKEINKWNAEEQGLENDIIEKKKKEEDNSKRITQLRDVLKSDNNDLKDENNKLDLIEKEIKKEQDLQPLFNKRKDLDREMGKIDKEFSDLEEKKKNGQIIDVLDFKLDIKKATEIIDEFERILNNIRNYLTLKIEEQREGAAKKFNENIKRIIKELNFSEFKEISLDLKDNCLKIIRRDDTVQSISSLSQGEKDVIAALLQICAKETYLPQIPFLIGDDIISDIDPARQESFINYLRTIAVNNNWFILLTKVTDEDLTISEI